MPLPSAVSYDAWIMHTGATWLTGSLGAPVPVPSSRGRPW